MMNRIGFLAIIVLPLALTACGTSSTEPDVAQDTTVQDVAQDMSIQDVTQDTNIQDVAQDMSIQDVTQDTNIQDVVQDVIEDFNIREPAAEALFCQVEFGGEYWIGQLDHVCRIENEVMSAELYLQANPVDCGQFGNPSYEGVGAWLKTAEGIVPVSGSYDFGGRHNNDIISFTHEGTTYLLYHSSIGWGWRACTSPDCMIVCAPGTVCQPDTDVDVAQDGCTRAPGDPPPELQVICVMVNSDGTIPEFLDPWQTQSPYGEEGEMILPCAGEQETVLPAA